MEKCWARLLLVLGGRHRSCRTHRTPAASLISLQAQWNGSPFTVLDTVFNLLLIYKKDSISKNCHLIKGARVSRGSLKWSFVRGCLRLLAPTHYSREPTKTGRRALLPVPTARAVSTGACASP